MSKKKDEKAVMDQAALKEHFKEEKSRDRDLFNLLNR